MATPIPDNRAAWSAWSVAAATGGEVLRTRGEGASGVGIVSDSRAAAPGVAFVALVGEAHDGHAHADAAIARGAALVVIARGRPLPAGDADVVVVDDTLRAWGDLAAAHVRAWRRARASVARGPMAQPACVVAITGSAGKTTTRAICAALLATEGPCRATPGNLNNRVGVPAVAFGLTPDDRFAVLEMGMSVAGEIAALGAIAPPDVALLLNVGVAHAEGVGGSRAGVAREKGAIYEALGPAGVAVVNLDDAAACAQVARSRAGREVTFGRITVLNGPITQCGRQVQGYLSALFYEGDAFFPAVDQGYQVKIGRH